MKITRIQTTHLRIPMVLDGAPEFADRPGTALDVLVIQVETDEGITGWGEAFGHLAAQATVTTLDAVLAPRFQGRDPTDITGLMSEIGKALHPFGRNGAQSYALSGVEMALWDIAGKRAGLPLHALFGGTRVSDVPAYASLLRYNDPAEVARHCVNAVAAGYRYIKLHEIGVEQVAAARKAVGPDITLMLDTNCPWNVRQALEMAQKLRPYDLRWLEEPVWPPEDRKGLARVRTAGVPLAAGENAAGLHDFFSLFDAGAIDFAQPSVAKIGISACREVMTLAKAHGVDVAPHNASFGAASVAALHLVASGMPEPLYERLYIDLVAYPFGSLQTATNGRMHIPSGPGLGCEPDPDVMRRFAVGLPANSHANG
jgi:D-galactarolactone cycloisomerase